MKKSEKRKYLHVVPYTICSIPSYITFTCPYCNEENVVVDYSKVRFNNPNEWDRGGYVDCPDCGEEVILGRWEYD